MRNEFEIWLKRNVPAGQARTGRLLVLAAAGTASATVWLSVVLMAGLGLPPGDLATEARAPAAAAAPVHAAAPASAQQRLRHASALPTVTVVGRRVPDDKPVLAATDAAALPARPALADATIGVSVAGDHRRQ